MAKLNNYIMNAIKYYANYRRVSKLRKKGATIGRNVAICKGSKFDNPEKLTIGDNVYIGNNFYSNCVGGLTIGKGTLISYNCTVMTYNHDYKEDLFMPYGLSNIYKEVVIKENVWIGINVNIAGGRFLSEREEKTHKYDLLEVRAMYHPIHYLKFNKKIKKIKKDVITFDEIKKVYDDYDTYILTYRWCENNNYIADWKNETIKKAE